MGEVPPSHDAVRAYLDSAVAEAAERWVGRATDATAYADLVGAVLARRATLSPAHRRPEGPSHSGGLPTRPPGRHRLPPVASEAPDALDLKQSLHQILGWLEQPDP